jgi:hypothetical protein
MQPGVLRIRRPWLAFVVGFPGAIGTVALVAALSRDGMADGALPLAVASLGLAVVLLVLGALSRVWLFPDRVAVRFFGVRTTKVRFADLTTATFGMVFPSISFALTLTDRGGQRATIHANWWDYEPAMMDAVCRALIHHDVAVDRMTASVIARVLRGISNIQYQIEVPANQYNIRCGKDLKSKRNPRRFVFD